MILGGNIGILAAAFSFVIGMMMLGTPDKAERGNRLLVFGMILALVSTIGIQSFTQVEIPWSNIGVLLTIIAIGTLIGLKVSYRFELTKMPELVSLFNGFGGAAAGLIGIVGISSDEMHGDLVSTLILSSSIFLGFMTFSGSYIALLKLGGKYKMRIPNNRSLTFFTLAASILIIGLLVTHIGAELFILTLVGLVILSLLHGVSFASSIGGGDMPILISVLNGFTGALTAIAGIYFGSTIMILAGVFVTATGIILTFQMCTAMNTTLKKVIFGATNLIADSAASEGYSSIHETTSTKVATDIILMKKVVIVPGFGLAVAKAQKACRELKNTLEQANIEMKFVIHPVAGRMPGHMNVLLAEAGIDYADILDLDKGNQYLEEADLCLIIGANDVVNTSAEDDQDSIIHGMPIVQTYKAKKVVVIKRGLGAGYAGIKNPLFEKENTQLLLTDAKQALESIVDELKQ
ncbi:MAG: NAD(P)(+) transhydrogenase (Re/Si-specific) subunit beta [Flavobacteriales bacterium]|nr:NAD(P)(+) transhydrogenase (Re/Si-specific) subunit beta [Flavobacteriales bacterium]